MTNNNYQKMLIFSVLAVLLLNPTLVNSEDTVISVVTDYTSYDAGEMINIMGKINLTSNIDSTPIILRIIDNNDNVVTVDQFTPDRDGVFQKSYLTSGPLWKSSGEYFIIINYSTYKNQTSFSLNNDDDDKNDYNLSLQNLKNTLVDDTNDTSQLTNDTSQLTNDTSQLTNDTSQLTNDTSQLTNDTSQLTNDTSQLTNDTSQLTNDTSQLTNDTSQLTNDTSQLTTESIVCGPGTIEKDGMCIPEVDKEPIGGGGCLIATATYDSELSSQIQSLRHIRDDVVLNTQSGQTFMQVFNNFYYSFSPYVSDLERNNPIFKETVKIFISPLLYSLSILNDQIKSEHEMIFYGIAIISFNILVYFILPFTVLDQIKKRLLCHK